MDRISKLEKNALRKGMKVKAQGRPKQLYAKVKSHGKTLSDFNTEIKETKALIIGLEMEYYRSNGQVDSYTTRLFEYKQRINVLNLKKEKLRRKAFRALKVSKKKPRASRFKKAYKKLKKRFVKSKKQLKKFRKTLFSLKKKIKLREKEKKMLRKRLVQYGEKQQLLKICGRELKTGVKQRIPTELELRQRVFANFPLLAEGNKKTQKRGKINGLAKKIVEAVKQEISEQPLLVEQREQIQEEPQENFEVEGSRKQKFSALSSEEKKKRLKRIEQSIKEQMPSYQKSSAGRGLIDNVLEGREIPKPVSRAPVSAGFETNVSASITKVEKFKGIEKDLKMESVSTDFDKVLALVKQKGKISMDDAIKVLGMPKERIIEIAEILEDDNLVKVVYPPIGSTMLVFVQQV
ncbi:MAG: hypothetical protein Q7K42_03565 [Candidatus Diapherotrites archaeon]|nr:hypothetical protein [Candidatus Diapherotrites archaeon]